MAACSAAVHIALQSHGALVDNATAAANQTDDGRSRDSLDSRRSIEDSYRGRNSLDSVDSPHGLFSADAEDIKQIRQLQKPSKSKSWYYAFWKWRTKVNIFLEVPASSHAAMCYAIFMILMILFATLLFLIQSLPQYYDADIIAFDAIQHTTMAIFAADFVLRLTSAPNPWKWLLHPLHLVDMASFLPFYIVLLLTNETTRVGALTALRAVRLLQIFRILKLGRYSSISTLVVRTLLRSVDGFLLLAFMLSLALVVFSSLMFYAEQSGQTFNDSAQQWVRPDGSLSPFQSIPDTFWWCIVTITTVGYGDAFPVTPLGKTVACLTMVAGLLVLAFPIIIVGRNFEDEYERTKKENERKRKLRKLRAARQHITRNNTGGANQSRGTNREPPPITQLALDLIGQSLDISTTDLMALFRPQSVEELITELRQHENELTELYKTIQELLQRVHEKHRRIAKTVDQLARAFEHEASMEVLPVVGQVHCNTLTTPPTTAPSVSDVPVSEEPPALVLPPGNSGGVV